MIFKFSVFITNFIKIQSQSMLFKIQKYVNFSRIKPLNSTLFNKTNKSFFLRIYLCLSEILPKKFRYHTKQSFFLSYDI